MVNYTTGKKAEKRAYKLLLGVMALGVIFGFFESPFKSLNEDKHIDTVESDYHYESIVAYIGTIGKYKINMTLNHTQKTGEYYYESQGAENKLHLTILTDTLNQLIIEEKDVSDKVTGNFKGEFQNDSIYTGIFTNSKGKKFKFKLTPQ